MFMIVVIIIITPSYHSFQIIFISSCT
uniref:Uncharacterized protein n=1 Tax=Anguilla anguilla TaxID=7936 RepID=A0A0E9RSS1_ANGAN